MSGSRTCRRCTGRIVRRVGDQSVKSDLLPRLSYAGSSFYRATASYVQWPSSRVQCGSPTTARDTVPRLSWPDPRTGICTAVSIRGVCRGRPSRPCTRRVVTDAMYYDGRIIRARQPYYVTDDHDRTRGFFGRVWWCVISARRQTRQ